jgi:hypothetical protein
MLEFRTRCTLTVRDDTSSFFFLLFALPLGPRGGGRGGEPHRLPDVLHGRPRRPRLLAAARGASAARGGGRAPDRQRLERGASDP